MSESISRCLCVIRQHCLCLCSVFPLQFPGHGELLWGEAKVWGERSAPGLRFYVLVRVLQRLQERLDTTKQEHLQREVSWNLVGSLLIYKAERVYAIELHYGKCRYAVSLELEPYLGLKSGYICLCCVEFDHSFFNLPLVSPPT